MRIAIDSIVVRERKRRLDEAKVRELADSIRELGLLQPIGIRRDNVLAFGLHRLEACKLLGWREIEAVQVDFKEEDALRTELAEIDENLIRNDLTALERAEHLARRKEIYEALHPEAKAGLKRAYGMNKSLGRNVSETVSPTFATDTATKLGVSPRTIQQDVQIATAIVPEVRELIRDTPLADSKRELLTLARTPPEQQRKTAAQLIVSSESNEWYTPAKYVDAAREVLGGIDIDPASCEAANKTVKATVYYTAETNGLAHDWPGRVWLNPPYGGLTAKFVAKLLAQYKSGVTKAAVLLVNAHATDTDWFQPLWDFTLCFTNHRINFQSPIGRASGSTHGSAFVYLGPDPARFAKVFAQFGAIVRRWVP